MQLTELYQEIKKDFPIDERDLGNESLRTTKIWIKYIELYATENMRLEKMIAGRNTLISTKREYYSGNAPAEVYKDKPWNGRVPKSEGGLQKLVDNDLDVIAYDEGLIVQQQKIEVLKSCHEEVKRRGYAIKSAIDMVKFMNGA